MNRSESFWRPKRERLADPYLTPGDRAFIVGAQDGSFPDLGWHVPGEMGGVWSPPLKLLDGFWLQVNGHWTITAHEYATGPCTTKHAYHLESDLHVTRTQFAPDGEPGVVVRYGFQAPSSELVHVRFLARSDLQLVWSPLHEPEARTLDQASYLDDLGAWMVTSEQPGQCVVVGARNHTPIAHESGPDLWGPETTRGMGVSVALEYRIDVSPQEACVLDFVICGGIGGASEAQARYERIGSEADSMRVRCR